MVRDSSRKYLHQRLLPAIINSSGLNDEGFNNNIYQKYLDVLFWQIYHNFKLCWQPVLSCTINAVLHYIVLQLHCCNATCIMSLKLSLQFEFW